MTTKSFYEQLESIIAKLPKNDIGMPKLALTKSTLSRVSRQTWH